MKTTTISKAILLNLAVLACGIFASRASAALVDVDFSPGGNPAQSGAAVLGAAGDIWNNITAGSGTAVVLNDTTGTATSVTLSFTENFGVNDTGGSAMDAATTNLMQDFGGFQGQTLALAGLAPNTAYELALYGAGDQNSLNGASNGGQGTIFTIPQIGPTVQGVTTEVNPGSPTLGDRKISDGPGVAYALVTASSNATGAINIEINYNSTSFSTAPVNGFQIQPVSVPEPASLGLLTLGGIALLGKRRRAAAL